MLKTIFACDAVAAHWTDTALLGAMARFEAALALAQSDCGLLPRAAADSIAAVCAHIGEPPDRDRADAASPPPWLAHFEPQRLAPAARRAGTLAIPFVKALTAAVAAEDADAARWVHYGATSQDVADTAIVLQASAASVPLLALLDRIGDSLAALALSHRFTMMTGRTMLQPATPVAFGWKVAGWLSPLPRARHGLLGALEELRVLQLGGASGTRAALNGRGDEVAAAMAARLDLRNPAISWHGARDRIARLGSELALVTGAMSRIGRDLSLLMQAEVAEAFEPCEAGRGGSSAMPHKRNPVGSMLALQAGLRAPGLAATLLGQQAGEHERGLGTWQADWWTLCGLYESAGSGMAAIAEVLDGLRVDAAAMIANLERTQGFVFAEAVTIELAGVLGKPQASALMERVCRDALDHGRPLRTALLELLERDATLSESLSPERLDRLFDPAAQTGDSSAMIDRVLAEWRAR